MIGNAPRSLSTGVPGWETDQEEAALIALAQQYVPDGGVIVELGGEYGRSASQFGYACKQSGKRDIRIYTVDLFPEDHPVAAKHGGLLNVWRSNLAEAKLGDHHLLFLPIQGDTASIGKHGEIDFEIDLLFIDAGHTYDAVKRDIAAWIGYVKPGGVVVFHDYAKTADAHALHHEVKRAVDDYFSTTTREWAAIDLPDSLIAFEYVPVSKKVSGKEKLAYMREHEIVLGDEHDDTTAVDYAAELDEVLPEPVESAAKPKRKRSSKRK